MPALRRRSCPENSGRRRGGRKGIDRLPAGRAFLCCYFFEKRVIKDGHVHRTDGQVPARFSERFQRRGYTIMWKQCCATLALVCCLAVPAQAHFGMVIPSSATVTDKKDADLGLEISFSHPMDMQGMDMAAPRAFTVTANGKTENLTARLAPGSVMGHKAWKAAYRLNRPGVYQFALEPAPYFEPAEDCFIIHYTKTVVAAFGDEEGWDQPLGLKTEIVPLTRPFGNYAGNVFQGQVLLNGKPVPGALVEVECYNRDKAHAAPDAYFVTQTVRADANGVFAYGVPWAGWWGFAALNTAEEKLPHEGQPKDVELGAVLWVEFVAPRGR